MISFFIKLIRQACVARMWVTFADSFFQLAKGFKGNLFIRVHIIQGYLDLHAGFIVTFKWLTTSHMEQQGKPAASGKMLRMFPSVTGP